MSNVHYSMLIQWSDPDEAFLVDVPELPGCHTHGDTYEEAAKNGFEVIELWLEAARASGWSIPEPNVITAKER